MWDYDKLFAEGNIVGFKNEVEGRFGVYQITKDKELPREARYYNFGNRWDDFKNTNLARSVIFIQYIIRLDEHGNVVEKLFDREEADMSKPMPELENGMFIRVNSYEKSELGFVDAENNHVIYQGGGYDFIDDDDDNGYGIASKIVEVYDKDTCAFKFCDEDTLIWRSPEYQAYLDSKFN